MKNLKNLEYRIGDLVYLRTDPDQMVRIVTGVLFRPDGIQYFLASGDTGETSHYGFEITDEKNPAFL